MPTRVDFEISADGRTFISAASVPNDVEERKYGVITRDFQRVIPSTKARYLRVTAHTYGKIPAWHPGHDGDAWIFIDEILVK